MTKENVLEQLQDIFRNNFDDDTIVLQEEMTSADIDEWDSLEQINLVVAIQDTFHVSFTIEEVNSMKNVGEMIRLILSKAQ